MTTPTPPTSSSLSVDTMSAYWTEAWAKNQTGWKAFEVSKPFLRNVTELLATIQGAADTTAEVSDVDRARRWITGKRVFVPLCGDSHAVRFFVDMGASLVVGVDLASTAIQSSVATNFPSSDGFDAVKIAAEGSGHDGHNGFRVDILRRRNDEDASSASDVVVAQLFAASFTEVPLASLGPFDIVYDRASMVALPVSLRSVYVSTMVASLAIGCRRESQPEPIVMLELVRRRQETILQGPPFHIATDVVAALYDDALTAAGVEQRVVVSTINDAAATAFLAGQGDEAPPPFRFAWFAVRFGSPLAS